MPLQSALGLILNWKLDINSSDMGGASWWVELVVVQRLKCIDGHRLGPRKVAVIRSRQVAVDQGVLKHCAEWRCFLDPTGEWP